MYQVGDEPRVSMYCVNKNGGDMRVFQMDFTQGVKAVHVIAYLGNQWMVDGSGSREPVGLVTLEFKTLEPSGYAWNSMQMFNTWTVERFCNDDMSRMRPLSFKKAKRMVQTALLAYMGQVMGNDVLYPMAYSAYVRLIPMNGPTPL